MSAGGRVLLLGDGRIARAIERFIGAETSLLRDPARADEADVILSVLPAGLGERALELALATRRPLLDLADLEWSFYAERAAEIDAAAIAVLPGCGFCPGLVDFLLGAELEAAAEVGARIEAVEVLAGSLTLAPSTYPFLWCFEDLVAEFQMASEQTTGGETSSLPPFAGLREETLAGQPAESYLAASGFEHLAAELAGADLTYRNVRPRGFAAFFRALEAHGCFDEAVLAQTKALLERRALDNLSLAELRVRRADGARRWAVEIRCDAGAALNSIQLPTARFALAMLRLQREGLLAAGLLRCEQLGRQAPLRARVIDELRAAGIRIDGPE